MTTPDLVGLCERLRKVESSRESVGHYDGHVTTNWHRNPDGPEAAAAIESLSAENEALRRVVKQVSLLTVEGKDHTEFAAQYPTFAGLVEEARATLKGADHD